LELRSNEGLNPVGRWNHRPKSEEPSTKDDARMVCQCCSHREAVVHLTDIVNFNKRETHLCEGCARAAGLIPSSDAEAAGEPAINLQALVQFILGQPPAADPSGLTCPDCAIKYSAFRADGRFGCPTDYDSFREPLLPLLERIHRGLVHRGKTPRRAERHFRLAALNAELHAAVAGEHYEQAALVRDRIRAEESTDES